MRKLRIGLVGCGKRGIYLAGLFQAHPRAEVTALQDRFRACAERAAHALGLPHSAICEDFGALAEATDVDALLVTCDPTAQVDLACRAMEHGKHVCTEVPAAFTLEDCWRLDAFLAAEITAPAVLAAESARQGGIALDVPDFRR